MARFKMKELLFYSLTIIICFFIVSCTTGYDEPGENGISDGGIVSSVKAVDVLSGEEVNFPGDWQGELVYVNFFLTT